MLKPSSTLQVNIYFTGYSPGYKDLVAGLESFVKDKGLNFSVVATCDFGIFPLERKA